MPTRWHDNDAYGHVNNVTCYGFDTTVNLCLIGAGLLDIERGDPIGLIEESGCRHAASMAFRRAVEIGPARNRSREYQDHQTARAGSAGSWPDLAGSARDAQDSPHGNPAGDYQLIGCDPPPASAPPAP